MTNRARGGSVLRKLGFVDVWNVGLVRAPIQSFLDPGFRPEVEWLPATGVARTNADPFALEHEGRWWMLYEGLDHAVGRGFLVARELGRDGAPRPFEHPRQ